MNPGTVLQGSVNNTRDNPTNFPGGIWEHRRESRKVSTSKWVRHMRFAEFAFIGVKWFSNRYLNGNQECFRKRI